MGNTKKPIKQIPTKLVLHPETIKRHLNDPTELVGDGMDFRLYEERDGKSIELPSKDIEISDWIVRKPKTEAEGVSLGKAKIEWREKITRSVPVEGEEGKTQKRTEYRDRLHAVNVVTGPITTKQDMLKRERLLKQIGDPTLTLRSTLREAINGIRDLTKCSEVGIVLPFDEPITSEGARLRLYSVDKKVIRNELRLGTESKIISTILGVKTEGTQKPNQDDGMIYKKFRKIHVKPLKIDSLGGEPTIVGAVVLMNKGHQNILPADMETLDVVADSLALEIEKKQIIDVDPISGATSKTSFRKRGMLEIERNKKSPKKVIFAACDLDHFGENVTETFGHFAGTTVIQSFVRLARRRVSQAESGIFGGYGGDEFAIMLNQDRRDALKTLTLLKGEVEGHRFRFKLPAEESEKIEFGEKIGYDEKRDKITVTKDTKVELKEDGVQITLPKGAITVTIAVTSMDEVKDVKGNGGVFEQLEQIAFKRVEKKHKSENLRNTIIMK